jgi:hypothetical protein
MLSRSRSSENSDDVSPGVNELLRICVTCSGVPVSVASTSRCRRFACVVNLIGLIGMVVMVAVVRGQSAAAAAVDVMSDVRFFAHGPGAWS